MRVVVRRVSLSDVARAAGVAKATASRALSGRDDVGDATRARILDIAADLGYQPHRTAQALRTGRFGVVAISVPLEDPRAGEVVRVAALRAAHHGYQLLIDAERQEADATRVSRLATMSVDGVLLFGHAGSAGDLPVGLLGSLGDPLETIASAVDALVAQIAHEGDRAPGGAIPAATSPVARAGASSLAAPGFDPAV